jgi:hypothetical protein
MKKPYVKPEAVKISLKSEETAFVVYCKWTAMTGGAGGVGGILNCKTLAVCSVRQAS